MKFKIQYEGKAKIVELPSDGTVAALQEAICDAFGVAPRNQIGVLVARVVTARCAGVPDVLRCMWWHQWR